MERLSITKRRWRTILLVIQRPVEPVSSTSLLSRTGLLLLGVPGPHQVSELQLETFLLRFGTRKQHFTNCDLDTLTSVGGREFESSTRWGEFSLGLSLSLNDMKPRARRKRRRALADRMMATR